MDAYPTSPKPAVDNSKGVAAMLLLSKSFDATLVFSVLVLSIPFKSRAPNPAAAIPNAYMSLSQSNLKNPIPNPNPNQNAPVSKVLCFDPEAGLNLTAVAKDCAIILNDVILRLDGPFQKRSLSHQKYLNSNGYWVAARWAFGQCIVCARPVQSASIQLVTLFEVAQTANKILSSCVTSHIKGQGGIMPIESREDQVNVSLQGYPENTFSNAVDDTETLAPANDDDSKQTWDAEQNIHHSTRLHPRTSNLTETLGSLNEQFAPSSIAGDLNAKIDHDIDCFPSGSHLPDANADDCKFIINSIILGLKDPFREQTWGFIDTVDINLSLPEYLWKFKDCYIRVRNIDESQVDTFRPVDVAELAQTIVRKCVAETKERLGGNADIGRLRAPRSFYVVVSGLHRRSGESSVNDTALSLPSGGPRTLESRESLSSPEGDPLPIVLTEGLKAGDRYPVHCFDPTSMHRFKPAITSDCSFIVDEMILRLPDPMLEQTFGYTDDVDINLRKKENSQFVYGQCVVFIRDMAKTDLRDRFRFLDVAYTAHRITEQCVEGSKYAVGGTADVGTTAGKFYVGVGGLGPSYLENGTFLELTPGTGVSSPYSAIPASLPRNRTGPTSVYNYRDTRSVELGKRSSNATKLEQASGFVPTMGCITDGMAVAQKINIQDCTNAAVVLLSDPLIFTPQIFTTEPTGGIKMPFVQHNRSCYLMMDTSFVLSVSESITLLKMVYWASEIMLKCISGREQGFGGVSPLDVGKGIFVSVTGVDPRTVRNELASLSNQSISAMELEDTALQRVDLGQS